MIYIYNINNKNKHLFASYKKAEGMKNIDFNLVGKIKISNEEQSIFLSDFLNYEVRGDYTRVLKDINNKNKIKINMDDHILKKVKNNMFEISSFYDYKDNSTIYIEIEKFKNIILQWKKFYLKNIGYYNLKDKNSSINKLYLVIKMLKRYDVSKVDNNNQLILYAIYLSSEYLGNNFNDYIAYLSYFIDVGYKNYYENKETQKKNTDKIINKISEMITQKNTDFLINKINKSNLNLINNLLESID